jgi:hypothetical protein
MPERISTGVWTLATQLLEHVVPVHVGQVEVEKDDVVIVELAEIEAFFPQVGGIDVEAFGRQHEFDSLGRGRLILDQQHAHGSAPSCHFPAFFPADDASQGSCPSLTIGPVNIKG